MNGYSSFHDSPAARRAAPYLTSMQINEFNHTVTTPYPHHFCFKLLFSLCNGNGRCVYDVTVPL